MNTTRSSIPVAEVPGYTELQREIHDALRAQHPEWIEADGESPRCDYYESLFAQLLVSHRAHARAYYDDLLNITRTERLSATANSSMAIGYAETRNMVFPKMASAIRQSSRETNQQPTKLINRTNMGIQINNKKEQTITNFRKGVFTNDRK